MSDSGYLTNQLLIAMPQMGDPNFAQTVALVCDHSSRGALGLILNKPLPMRMGEIFERGEKIDRITVANELMKFNELESCDGLSYLVSLDDGLPQIPNVDSYIRLVKDKSVLRSIIFASQHMINRCMMADMSDLRSS